MECVMYVEAIFAEIIPCPAHLLPEHPPSNKVAQVFRNSHLLGAPRESISVSISTCSRRFLAAIARDRQPNCVPGRLEEAVRETP